MFAREGYLSIFIAVLFALLLSAGAYYLDHWFRLLSIQPPVYWLPLFSSFSVILTVKLQRGKTWLFLPLTEK
jgi:hypothetical protein